MPASWQVWPNVRPMYCPRSYLQRNTTNGEPALLHAYAGTAHIAQGITTGRAFVLGSDTAYREWGYVAWSRARLQTRFYVCEPDIDLIADEHHTAAGHEPDAFEDVVDAMERSRAQRAAIDLVDRATISPRHDHAVARWLEPSRAARGIDVARHLATSDGKGWRSRSRALVARRDPPAYILSVLGARPAQPDRAAAWDGAVQHVARYRIEHGISDADDALGPRPAQLIAQVAWRDARRTLERTHRELSRPSAARNHPPRPAAKSVVTLSVATGRYR